MSKRKFLSFVFAALTLIFAYLLVAAPVAHAADVQWQEGKLMYDGKEFTRASADDIPDEVNIPSNATVYVYTGNTVPFAGTNKEAIYFSGDTNTSELDEAQFISFQESQDGSADNVSTARTVSIDTTTAEQADQTSDEDVESGASSCKVDGLGWIICPLTTMLAKGMDWIFGVIDGFLEVRPLGTTNDDVMMRSWSVMRNMANVAFVITFLVIIYAQLTSMGIGNYGLKKLLPRLIIAAILVNISYWVCAIAIDLSNILGASLQQLFIDMRNVVLGSNTNSWDLISWESVAGFVLSGGAIGAATVIGGAVALGSLGAASVGAFYLLLPILLGAFLSVLVVLLILTARQAILTILVLVAPLAMVAYLLPNTEKWFDKWRDLFVNMLILFPAFSLVFGGAQLAGILIIQNADDITVVILGMAVQVAPLAIVPLLLKLGGSVLTRIAGMVNNPNRGMIDRTKKWSQGRYDQSRALTMRRNRGMSTEELKKPRNALRRYAMFRDDDKREREGLTKINDEMSDAMFAQSSTGHRLHEAEHNAHVYKEQVENAVKTELQNKINVRGSQLHIDNVNLEASKELLNKATTATEAQLEEYRTKTPRVAPWGLNADILQQEVEKLRVNSEDVALQGLRKQSASYVRQKDFADMMSIESHDTENPLHAHSQVAQRVAAGIDPGGRLSAMADAESKLAKLEQEGLKNTQILMQAQALKQNTTLKVLTADIAKIAIAGGTNEKTGMPYDKYEIEAALEQQAQEGNINIIRAALGSEHVNAADKDMMKRIIARNIGTMKAKGGFDIQNDPSFVSLPDIKAEWQKSVTKQGLRLEDVRQPDFEIILKQRLAFGTISNLAGSAPNEIAGWKASYVESIGENPMELYDQAKAYIKWERDNMQYTGRTKDEIKKIEGDFKQNLAKAHNNVENLLKNANTRANAGQDRTIPLEKFYKDTPSDYTAEDGQSTDGEDK